MTEIERLYDIVKKLRSKDGLFQVVFHSVIAEEERQVCDGNMVL